MKKEYTCPQCGTNLLEVGIGGVFEYTQVLVPSGDWQDGEVGGFIEHYCQNCGITLPKQFGNEVEEKLTEEK